MSSDISNTFRFSLDCTFQYFCRLNSYHLNIPSEYFMFFMRHWYLSRIDPRHKERCYKYLVGDLLNWVMRLFILIQSHLLWMVRNLQPVWIVFQCIFTCNFIDVNHYIQLLFCVFKRFYFAPITIGTCCYSIGCFYFLVVSGIQDNLVDFVKHIVYIILKPFLLLYYSLDTFYYLRI